RFHPAFAAAAGSAGGSRPPVARGERRFADASGESARAPADLPPRPLPPCCGADPRLVGRPRPPQRSFAVSMTEAVHAAVPIRALVLRGIGWKFVSQVVLQLSGVLFAVVLARLLRPHDYGLAGMVLVAWGLGFVFSDFVLGAALVPR